MGFATLIDNCVMSDEESWVETFIAERMAMTLGLVLGMSQMSYPPGTLLTFK